VSLEQRKSHRYFVPSLRQEGELRFGQFRLPVRLLDQSAGGFAAMSWQPPGVEIDSAGLLRAGDDWHEIRLINVTPMEAPESEETSAPDDQGQCFRLGLYRLGDAFDPDKKEATWSWPMLRDHLNNIMPPHSSTVGFGMLFVIAVVVLPVVAILLMQNWNGNTVGDEVGLTKSIAATAKPGKQEPDWEKLSSGIQSDATTILSSGEKAVSLGRLANQAEELTHVIFQNPGASVFLLPQMVRQLRITEEQKRQLQQIVDTTSEVIITLEDQISGAISPEQYQKLNNMARNNALQFLSDEQRSKWKIISGESPQNKRVPPLKDDK
jgi:hypothetical protein